MFTWLVQDNAPALKYRHDSFECRCHQPSLSISSRFTLAFSPGCFFWFVALRFVCVGFGDFGIELFDLHSVHYGGLSPVLFSQSVSNITASSIRYGMAGVLPIAGRPHCLECGAPSSPPVFRRERRFAFADTRILSGTHGLAAEFKNLRSGI